jgi:arginine deiminase
MVVKWFLKALLGAAGLLIYALAPIGTFAQAPAYVKSDVDPLRRAIVLSPGDEIRRISLLAGEDYPVFPSDAMQPAASGQHRVFINLLERQGVEVLRLDKLIDSALRAARQKGELLPWLRRTFPRSEALWKEVDRIDAASLIGRGQFFYNRDSEGRFAPLLLPYKWMFYTRDIGVMTPRGLVITHFANHDRSKETALLEFAFSFAPELSRYPVAFSAPAEGVFLQGGDLIVLNEQTLLLGAGSLSEPRAAERLAQKLDMEVLAVSMPPLSAAKTGYGGWTPVHLQFLHLDSFFNLVDRKKVLAIPYMLEAQYAQENPVIRLLEDMDRHLTQTQQADPVRHKNRYGSVPQSIKALEAVGWVTRYEAGTGRATPLKKKLVDVMRERGYTVIPVGGEKGSLSTEQYLLERVFFELNFQGANVVALRPGVVAAYAENVHTIEALKKTGVEVLAFDGAFLAMWHGGPHCLTLPLERGH